MRVISKDMDKKEVTADGEISVDSDWRDVIESTYENIFRLRALHRLMRGAGDCDANASVDVKYSEEALARTENHRALPQHICATDDAVKLKSA